MSLDGTLFVISLAQWDRGSFNNFFICSAFARASGADIFHLVVFFVFVFFLGGDFVHITSILCWMHLNISILNICQFHLNRSFCFPLKVLINPNFFRQIRVCEPPLTSLWENRSTQSWLLVGMLGRDHAMVFCAFALVELRCAQQTNSVRS